MTTQRSTILITGATAGIGRETALRLAHRGHRVIATGRRAEALERLEADAGAATLETFTLDVTSSASIESAVEAVDSLTGGQGVDALINNAGFGMLRPCSETGDDELRRLYETNVFGLMKMTRAFLPRMMERRAGRIINVGSLGGRLTLPYLGAYNSTKYALESLSDALRAELHPFGIRVVLIEPGMIRTSFESTAVAELEALRDTPYAPIVEKYGTLSQKADRMAADPAVVANAITRAVERRRPAARYVVPFSAKLALVLHRIVPTPLWDFVMRRIGFLHPKSLDFDRVASRSSRRASSSAHADSENTAGARFGSGSG